MPIKVCVGGTFNVIHEGHLALLSRAFLEGNEIFIGLTSDAMATRNRKVHVNDYETRLRELTRALDKISQEKPFHIFPIEDEFGPAVEKNFDIIVVSEETLTGAKKINEARQSHDLKPLAIVVIGMVVAGDGKPVSSSRIISGQA